MSEIYGKLLCAAAPQVARTEKYVEELREIVSAANKLAALCEFLVNDFQERERAAWKLFDEKHREAFLENKQA